MKFVYVIVGTEENFMVEKALLSIYTLRKHNPEATVSILLDDETSVLIKKYDSPISELVDETVIPPLPEGLLPIQKSRFLKTSLRGLVRGDLLYIDSDTIITGSLKNLESLDFDIAAVTNRHGFYDKRGKHPMCYHYHKITGIEPEIEFKIKHFYNGGVILAKDSEKALDFFETWHKQWWKVSSEKGFHKDQVEMWHTNTLKGGIIKELDGIYNCQIVYPKESLPYLFDAKIIHYFSTTTHVNHLKLKQNHFLSRIREQKINSETEEWLDNIKMEYYNGLEIIMDSPKRIMQSPAVNLLKELLLRYPRVYKLLNQVSYHFLRPIGYK